ncbi:cortical protein KAR9-domain-containing protein [Lipomyces tetrasporus]|uniref:Cortical protein KAR9-domain-containing protein n=1 Tax=Lipomyces tetrasporus TaxID=54092 RepID=A0AAD7QXA1_9ASCO|nr:cortical protein KAR9-domain-containing protein [Lipomyces tetrasporus]KAJ8103159.1 cortical protein KAR9-domain-containing protein [Lipomyces tetrasporus]
MSPSTPLSRSSKSDCSQLPFASTASLLSSIPLPTVDEDDEALATFLHRIRSASAGFEELGARHGIRLIAAGSENLVAVENQFSNLKRHLDFLRPRANDGNYTSSTAKDILSVVDSIEDNLRKSREQVDIALEWSELHDSVMSDLESVMEESWTLLAELQHYQRTHDITEVDRLGNTLDVDALMSSLKQSPQPGHGKLVNMSDADKIQNSKLYDLSKKIQPLRVSLDLLDPIIGDLIPRLEIPFPGAHKDLITKRKLLDAKWKKLSFETDTIKRQMGEERWIAMLRECANQARKLMTEFDNVMNNLDGVLANGCDAGTIQRHKELYEQKSRELIPEILKVLGLFSGAMEDKVTISGDIKREHMHFNNFWNDLDERIRVFDQKYDLDIYQQIGSTWGRESRSSMRSSLSSTSATTVEFNFRGSRSRSRTSAQSKGEPTSSTYLSPSSSPFDEEPCLQTPTVPRKANEDGFFTPTEPGRQQSRCLSMRSVSREQLCLLKAPPSAIPVRKRPSITPDLFTEPASLPRARTPSAGQHDTKRRIKSIPQPNFTPMKADIPPVPAVIPQSTSFTMKRLQASHEIERGAGSVVPVTPTRKQSQVFSKLERGRTVEKENGTATGHQSARKSLIPGPTSTSKLAKFTTILTNPHTHAHTPQRTPRPRTVSSRDPFGPSSSVTLNHHASTPNLSSLAKRPSRANLIGNVGKASVPPLPVIQPQTPLKAPAKTYKMPAGLSPNSQQKYYIKYGSAAAGDAAAMSGAAPAMAAPAGDSVKKHSARKSIGTVKDKPRWR